MNALTLILGQYLDISFNGEEACSYKVIDCKPEGKSIHLRVYMAGGTEPHDIQIRPHPVEYPEGGWKHHIPDRDMERILLEILVASKPIIGFLPSWVGTIAANYYTWKVKRIMRKWNEFKKLKEKHEVNLKNR